MSHGSQRDSKAGRRLLEAVRDACRHLPEVEEVVDGFGHHTFKVRKKSFVIAGMGEGGMALSIKTDHFAQEALLRKGPYYRTPYIGQHGWVSIADPLAGPWMEVRELIVDAYRMAAPKRLRAQVPDAAGEA